MSDEDTLDENALLSWLDTHNDSLNASNATSNSNSNYQKAETAANEGSKDDEESLLAWVDSQRDQAAGIREAQRLIKADHNSTYAHSSREQSAAGAKPRSIRCAKRLVGGPQHAEGLYATLTGQKRCSHLFCCACDFKVIRLDGYAWSNQVTYYWLRNNAPDLARLLENTNEAQSSAAYACQCWWETADALRTCKNQSWICQGHLPE